MPNEALIVVDVQNDFCELTNAVYDIGTFARVGNQQ